MKIKTYLLTLLFAVSCLNGINLEAKTSALTPQVRALLKDVKNTDKKLAFPNWNFQFEDSDDLYQYPLEPINNESYDDFKIRNDRMLHASFMKRTTHNEVILKKIIELSTYSHEIISYIKKQLSVEGDVQHISVYGSFLYNEIDPDDVDLLVIIDSPLELSLHHEVSFEDATGSNIEFPKLSFQIVDYNTYVKVKNHSDPSHLNQNEKRAQQHLATVGSWYLTIYGYDFRYDDPIDLMEHTKLNYLHKSFQCLKDAGARLYKSAYQYLPPESEKVRLRKVVSRLLISDFLIPVLDESARLSPQLYEKLQDQIRNTNPDDMMKLSQIEHKIKKVYFERLRNLLIIANKQGKLHEITFKK